MSNVGYATLQIIPSAKGFQAALDRETTPGMDAVGSKAGKTAGRGFSAAFLPSLKGIGGALAATFAVTKGVDFLKGAIGEASDLNETVNKSNVIFGENAGAMNKWASGSVKALGISKREALATASTFGDFFRQMGLAAPRVADLSRGFLKLSADIGSFQNADTGEVSQAFTSALRGEFESLQKFLPAVNASRIASEALAQTHKKNAKELTAADKAQALYSLALKDGASASNDWAETQGGLAGQQKMLSANLEDLKGKIGSALLPVITALTGGVNRLFTSLDEVREPLKALALPVLQRVGDFVRSKVLPAVQAFAEYVRATIIPALRDWWTVFSTQVLPVLQRVGAYVVGTLVPRLVALATAIATRLRPVFDALVKVFRESVLPTISQLVAKFAEWWPTIQRVIEVVVTVTGFVLKLAAAILGKVLPPLIRFGFFLAVVVVKSIAAVIGVVIKVIGWLFDFGAAVGRVGKKVGEAVGWIKNKFGDLVGVVKGLPGRISAAASGMFDGIRDAFRGALNWIIDKWNGLSFRLPEVDSHIPGIGKVGGFGLSTPNIDRLAKGGIVPRTPGGRLVIVGEGHEDEAVIPLSKLPQPPPPPAQGGPGDHSPAAPLVGSLTLQSSGSMHDDLEEAMFALRCIRRGGRP